MMPEMRGEHATSRIPPLPAPPDPAGAQAGQGPAPQSLFAWYAPGFSDALGDRLLLFDNTDGRPLELLRLRPEFARAADFEFSLRERAHELAGFDDGHHARVCRVDRLPDPGGGLAIVSEHVEGRRLSEVLTLARQRRARVTPDIALALVSDLVGAVAAFHERGPHLAHGALGPERLVVAPGGRILVTEYVLGVALRRVPLSREAFWQDMRIALPPDETIAAFDQRTDVLQIGLTALALLLGRTLAPEDFPDRTAALLGEAEECARLGGWDAARWRRFRSWLGRAVQLDPGPFARASDARLALQDVLHGDGEEPFPPIALARFLTECAGSAPAGTRLRVEAAEGPGGLPKLSAGTVAAAPTEDGGAAATDAGGLLVFPAEAPVHVHGVQPTASLLLPAAAPETVSKPPLSAWHRLFSPQRRYVLVGVLSLLVVLEGLYIGTRFITGTRGNAVAAATLKLESNPGRAAVTVDGRPAGTTPTTLKLGAGRHAVELALGPRHRAIALTLEAGASVSQFVELPPEAPGAGQISVRSEPAGARVTIDGQQHGQTPVLVGDLAVGPHQVRIDSRGRSVTQSVNVQDAATTALFVPFTGGDAPTAGWLSIASVVELQVYEDAELLGTSRSERIMLPAGRHELTLVNELVGFRATREVQVPVGKTADVEVAIPNGSLDVNAAPWAEVWIDDKKVGETPLAGVPIPLGRHRVTFKHPKLGERTLDCLVTLHQPVRLSADLRK